MKRIVHATFLSLLIIALITTFAATHMMDVLTIILFIAAFMKLIATCQAIWWLINNGVCYREELEKGTNRDEAIEKCKGSYLLFGFKDIRIRKLKNSVGGHTWHTCKRLMARLFHATLFRFHRLATITSLCLPIIAWYSHHNKVEVLLSQASHSGLLYILAVLMLGTTLLLSVEIIYSYALLGSYAVSFHGIDPESDRWAGKSQLLLELRAIVLRILYGSYIKKWISNQSKMMAAKELVMNGVAACSVKKITRKRVGVIKTAGRNCLNASVTMP
jgi:hypothetical protein